MPACLSVCCNKIFNECIKMLLFFFLKNFQNFNIFIADDVDVVCLLVSSRRESCRIKLHFNSNCFCLLVIFFYFPKNNKQKKL